MSLHHAPSRLSLVAALALALGGCLAAPAGPSDSCAADSDCPAPLHCDTGSGQCVAACSETSECPSTHECVNQRCLSRDRDDGGRVSQFDGSAGTGRDGGGGGGDGGGGSNPDGGGGGSGDGGGGSGDGGGTSTRDGGRAESCSQRDLREACGSSIGTCRPGIRTCNGEFWGPCIGAVGPSEEQCDGLDHDCDGIPDNRPTGCDCRNGTTRNCYNGPAGTENVGTCRAGSQTCVDGRFGSCEGAIEPRPGVCTEASCTGAMNPGCECIVGNTQPCYTGPATTRGRGICRDGSQACVATASGSTWGECTGQQLPESVDLCDGRDHDCDGTPNNPPSGCVCSPGQTQSCYTGPAGTAGMGTCRAGSQSCTLVGGTASWGACTGEITPSPGNCNVASCLGPDVPNPGCDCINGRTQSCYEGAAGTLGVGACTGGNQTCAGGAWGACVGQTLPQSPDACVPPTATITSHRASDLNCNGQLERHNPAAQPTATAPTATAISVSPFVYAIQVEPLVTVTLRGGATDADGAGTFSYRWRLLAAPAGNTAGLSGAPGGRPTDISTQQNPTLFAQLAGDYDVAVRALDSTGCQSDEVRVLIRVKPHSAIHLQLTWDQSTDIDLQLVQGSASPIFTTNACYWGGLNPDWGTVDPSLDIDDLAGCNPENINYGSIGGAAPPLNSSYAVWIHYYCNRRGHRPNATNPAALCYEPTEITTPANATLKVFVDGVLAKIDGTSQDAIFTTSLTVTQTWKPATIRYDASGVWRISAANEPKGTAGNGACTGSSTCTCSQITNAGDPYCGTGGAACRQRFP